eukprot:scaffold2128_cov38-Cyclotella_meneghiniana.AAC.1
MCPNAIREKLLVYPVRTLYRCDRARSSPNPVQFPVRPKIKAEQSALFSHPNMAEQSWGEICA